MLKLLSPLAIFLLLVLFTAIAAIIIFTLNQTSSSLEFPPSSSHALPPEEGIVNVPLPSSNDPYEYQPNTPLAKELNLPDTPESLLSQYDQNKDLQLSSKEFLKIRLAPIEDIEMLFDLLDKDGNRSLSLPELYYAYRPKFH